MNRIAFHNGLNRRIAILLLLPAFCFISLSFHCAVATTIVDSNQAEVKVAYAPGELVYLRVQVEQGVKTWVLLQPTQLFPGFRFARPTDEYAAENGRYVFLFSANDQFTPDAPNLFYSASSNIEKIDFGLTDFNGLREMTILTQKGELFDGLETVQTITVLEPLSVNYYTFLQDDIEGLFGEARDVSDDIEDIFDDLF